MQHPSKIPDEIRLCNFEACHFRNMSIDNKNVKNILKNKKEESHSQLQPAMLDKTFETIFSNLDLSWNSFTANFNPSPTSYSVFLCLVTHFVRYREYQWNGIEQDK